MNNNLLEFHSLGGQSLWTFLVQSMMGPTGRRPQLPIGGIGGGRSPFQWRVDGLEIENSSLAFKAPYTSIESVIVTASNADTTIRFTVPVNESADACYSFEVLDFEKSVHCQNIIYEEIKVGKGNLSGPTKSDLQTMWLTQQFCSVQSRPNYVPDGAMLSILRLNKKGSRWLISTTKGRAYVLDTSSTPHAEMVKIVKCCGESVYALSSLCPCE